MAGVPVCVRGAKSGMQTRWKSKQLIKSRTLKKLSHLLIFLLDPCQPSLFYYLPWHDSSQGLWLYPRGFLSQPLRLLVLASRARMGKLTSRGPLADSELKRKSLKH